MAGPVAAPAAEAAARYESGAVDGGGADRSEEEHAPREGYAPGSVRASPAPSMPLPMAASKSRALLPFGAGSAAPIVAVAMSRSPSPARASMQAGGVGALPGGGGPLGASAGPSAAPGQLSPTDDVLDFDGLVLPPPRSSDRGRLVASVAPSEQKRLSLFVEIPPPKEARDPGAAGLLFDHVFHGTTTCRVPSSTRPVRVPVDRRPARSTPRLAVVPRENAEVFREAEVDNPFDGPLLPGPIDVLLDGSLVAESSLSLVDRGGRARVGMGVEDRVKVARNVRIEEKSAGLLGGQRTVDHAVTIDVVSSLPYPALLEIRDRTPCTEEDSGVEVKLVSATPAPHAKDIDGAGAILRGGLLWQLPLDAGAAAKVAFQYRIALSAKDEVVGGNRRD